MPFRMLQVFQGILFEFGITVRFLSGILEVYVASCVLEHLRILSYTPRVPIRIRANSVANTCLFAQRQWIMKITCSGKFTTDKNTHKITSNIQETIFSMANLKKSKAFIYYTHSYIQLKSCGNIKLEMFPNLLLLGYSDSHVFTRIMKSYKKTPRESILSWCSLKIQVQIQIKHATKTGCFHSGFTHLHFHESVKQIQ